MEAPRWFVWLLLLGLMSWLINVWIVEGFMSFLEHFYWALVGFAMGRLWREWGNHE